MARIRPGVYETEFLAIEVREEGEFTVLSVDGADLWFNANGFNVPPLNAVQSGPEQAAAAAEDVDEVQSSIENRGSMNSGNSAA